MMNLLARFLNARHKHQALVTAFVAGGLLVLPGCGIPKLRQALPGPALPDSFGVPTIAEPLYDAAGSPAFGASTRFVSLVQAARPITPPLVASSSAYDRLASSELQSDAADAGVVGADAERIGPGILGSENSSYTGFLDFFNDPALSGLIEQALVGNQELNILAEEVRIACNEVHARRGEYLPFVTFGAGAGLEKSGRFTRWGAVEEQLDVLPGKPFPDPLPDFLVATNISWELDIWRKLRNAKDASALRFLATQEGRNYVVTRLVAEMAENYYELLALDNQLQTLDKTIEIQQQSLEVAKANKAAGRGTELAVQRFQAEVHKNQSEKLMIYQDIVEAENRINFLVGRYPQRVERMPSAYIDLYLPALVAGVPSQLLLNRADVRAAERDVAAAGLDVQVTRARFYPSLSLNAGVGYQAFNPKYLFFTPESLIYNAVGDLTAPLINKNAIRADYLTANAKQLQAIYDYQRTVLNAYTEVVNHMAKVDNYGKSIEIKKQQVAALEASVDVATRLFQNARAEYVEVLLAQREMMEARMVLIDTKRQQLGAVVYAYQALGGGAVLQDIPCNSPFGHSETCGVDCSYPDTLVTH